MNHSMRRQKIRARLETKGHSLHGGRQARQRERRGGWSDVTGLQGPGGPGLLWCLLSPLRAWARSKIAPRDQCLCDKQGSSTTQPACQEKGNPLAK